MSILAGSIYVASTAAFSVLAIVVGVRLVLLSRRTKRRPERSLGLAIALTAGLGYGTLMAAMIGRRAAGWDDAPSFYALLMGFGWVCHHLGVTFMLDFVRRVFRPGERWARFLQVGLCAVLWGGWLADTAHGGMTALRPGIYYWISFSVIGTYPLWAAAEALHYWSLMRKRVKLGLADPLVANRFLLWSVAALCTVTSIWTVQVPTLLGYEQLSPDAAHITSLTMVGTSALGIVTIGAYWLTFFPPKWYRARFAVKEPSEANS